MRTETKWVIGVIIFIVVMVLFAVALAASDPIDHSDHVGPKGGHWHYNSAGHKTYYKPR